MFPRFREVAIFEGSRPPIGPNDFSLIPGCSREVLAGFLAMTTFTFTKSKILSAIPGEYADTERSYLRLYVTDKGKRTLGVYKWSPELHRPVRISLGEYMGEDAAVLRDRALDAFRAHEAKAKNRKAGTPEPEKPLTLRHYLTAYTVALRADPATGAPRWAETILTRIYGDWLDLPMASITQAMLDDRNTRTAIANGPAAAGKAAKAFKAVFSYARKKRGYQGRDITLGLKVQESPQRTRVLDDDERARVVTALDHPTLMPYVRPFIRLLMLTGVRWGNLASARWEDMDLGTGEWIIPWRKSKNRREIRVRLRPDAVQVLKEWRSYQELDGTTEEWVFPSPKNSSSGHIEEPSFAWNRVQGLAGLKKHATLHDLRRTFGSTLLQADVPMAVVRDALGHKSIAVTEKHYAFLSKRAIDSHIDRVRL